VAAGFICSFENEEHYFHSNFSELESTESSTWRELTAIQEALFSFKDSLSGKCIKILTDSQNCVRIVNSGSTRKALQDIAFSIFVFCLQKQISLDIVWIPRSLNDRADYISKFVDYDDWFVSSEFFEFMNELWGPYDIDRFANFKNARLQRFNSLFLESRNRGSGLFFLRLEI
jgi:ribonuclease HI